MVRHVTKEQYLLAKEKLKQLDCKELEATKIRVKGQYSEEREKCKLLKHLQRITWILV